jgi:hypothetical protein
LVVVFVECSSIRNGAMKRGKRWVEPSRGDKRWAGGRAWAQRGGGGAAGVDRVVCSRHDCSYFVVACGVGRVNAGMSVRSTHTKLYSFKLCCKIVSLTAANTNRMFSVSVNMVPTDEFIQSFFRATLRPCNLDILDTQWCGSWGQLSPEPHVPVAQVKCE